MIIALNEEETNIIKEKTKNIIGTILHANSTQYSTQVNISREALDILQIIERKENEQ